MSNRFSKYRRADGNRGRMGNCVGGTACAFDGNGSSRQRRAARSVGLGDAVRKQRHAVLDPIKARQIFIGHPRPDRAGILAESGQPVLHLAQQVAVASFGITDLLDDLGHEVSQIGARAIG